ncbi:MAG: recombinase zinc beta ribbon domain-containing protein [Phycisphaerae bacterium]|nr:MAG: hypothetical protein EDS66_16030 [Planctomycetota bacterium]KAB2948781.1 MAG: hypothetical protein F9K17_05205 [Phycisphaerae bacterium]MBE7457726.1 recombinase zinc beta ribbon domain-containing protein [Planctomycetia bacterium]MCK6463754.1 zinc ribbon domain-containing protein [Phycisphaerae bacterium]MCL4717530.1 recombinase zinc beta ribbon domain-containing protein [Phycisphaerae bacterium]
MSTLRPPRLWDDAHLTSKGNWRYRYYLCLNVQKRGWENCPNKSVPAAEIERFVLERIKAIGKDDEVLARALA